MSDELILLSTSLGLYLKPTARISIVITIPEKSIIGKSISNWELMETIKKKSSPNNFTFLKVCISSFSKVALEGELNSLKERDNIIKKLDGSFIKLSGFQERFQISAVEGKTREIKQSDWEIYFKENCDMEESVPGKRADTLHISGIPRAWFKSSELSSNENSINPDYVIKTFEKFGKIQAIDVPCLDPYRDRINSFLETGHDILVENNGFRKATIPNQTLLFDAFIQFEEYSSFCECISQLNGMKMMKVKTGDKNSPYSSNFEFDFDRKQQLSTDNIQKRDNIRNKLQENDKIFKKKIDEENLKRKKVEEDQRRNEVEENEKREAQQNSAFQQEKENKLIEIQRELEKVAEEKKKKR